MKMSIKLIKPWVLARYNVLRDFYLYITGARIAQWYSTGPQAG
jgi:hypothetical protein